MEREQRWSELHGGLEPRGIPGLPRWLKAMWWLSRPLVAARVPPAAISLAGALSAVAAVAVVRPAPGVAVALLLLSVLCDGLDGAVALLGDRASRAGAIVDSGCDRLADLSFVAVIYRCGAPLWLAIAATVPMLAIEARRLLLAGARVTITVAERPTRLVCAVLAAGSLAVSRASWPASVCAAVLLGLGVIGLIELERAGRSRGTDEFGDDRGG